MRLRPFRVLRRRLHKVEVLDAEQRLVVRHLVLIAGAAQGNLVPVRKQPLEQGAHAWERLYLVQVVRLEHLGPALVDGLAVLLDLLRGQELRQQFAAALADLRAGALDRNVVAELGQHAMPGLGVGIDGVDQRSIDVEDHGNRHGGTPS